MRAVRHRRADGTETLYWYCRLTGIRLPDIADPGFAAAVAAARHQPAARYAPGSLGELLADWRRSPEYRATAPNTQRNRERYLALLDAAEWSTRQVAGLEMEGVRQLRAELLTLRDMLADRRGAGAASVFGQTVATVFAWAVERGRMAFSPLAQLKGMRLGHIPPWTEAEARHAMEKWPEPLRRAVTLAYHIGQRRGDLAALRWEDYDVAAGRITLMPEKTARRRLARGLPPLRLPVPKALAWELRRWRLAEPGATHILTHSGGKPWSKTGLANAVWRQLVAEGWDTRKGLHGLRKLRTERLLEGGATHAETAAAQGWDSVAMVSLYGRGAEQESLARAGVARLEKRVSKTVKNRR
ncbi:MAG: tyrosine-type recombinase/integrase [Actinobacteria bacterium]|nr:tyrosine-type recombinase/integrase [Actinomycetota bacterium]